MKFLVADDTGKIFEDATEQVLVTEKVFERIVRQCKKYEIVEITSVSAGLIEVWIHYPEE